MHYLQMALEKSAKAHFWGTSGVSGGRSKINRSHRVTEKILPTVYRKAWRERRGKSKIPGWVLKAAKKLCHEVDLLAPAVDDDDQRPDNCEYPWEVTDPNGAIVAVKSPLDQEFAPTGMVKQHGIAGFIKTIRATVADIVDEGPPT